MNISRQELLCKTKNFHPRYIHLSERGLFLYAITLIISYTFFPTVIPILYYTRCTLCCQNMEHNPKNYYPQNNFYKYIQILKYLSNAISNPEIPPIIPAKPKADSQLPKSFQLPEVNGITVSIVATAPATKARINLNIIDFTFWLIYSSSAYFFSRRFINFCNKLIVVFCVAI